MLWSFLNSKWWFQIYKFKMLYSSLHSRLVRILTTVKTWKWAYLLQVIMALLACKYGNWIDRSKYACQNAWIAVLWITVFLFHHHTKFDRTHNNVQHGCCTTSNYQYSTDINVGPNNEDAWGNFWSHTNVLVSKIPPPRSQLSHSIISVTWDSVFTFF